MAPQSNRTRLLVSLIVFSGFLLSLFKGVALAVTQGYSTLGLLYALGALMQAPVLLALTLTLVFLKRWFSASAIFCTHAIISSMTTTPRPASAGVAQVATLNQPVPPLSTPHHGHVLLTRYAYNLTKSLALLEPRPMPAQLTLLEGSKLAPLSFKTLPTLFWVRAGGLADVAASSSWVVFNHQCAERAVSARLLATG